MIITKGILPDFYLFQRIVSKKFHCYEKTANDSKYQNGYVLKAHRMPNSKDCQ